MPSSSRSGQGQSPHAAHTHLLRGTDVAGGALQLLHPLPHIRQQARVVHKWRHVGQTPGFFNGLLHRAAHIRCAGRLWLRQAMSRRQRNRCEVSRGAVCCTAGCARKQSGGASHCHASHHSCGTIHMPAAHPVSTNHRHPEALTTPARPCCASCSAMLASRASSTASISSRGGCASETACSCSML